MVPESDATRPLRAGRILARILLTIAGVIGGLVCFFACEGMFAGYPQYASGVLTIVAMFLIMAVGGAVWITDHRRIDAED